VRGCGITLAGRCSLSGDGSRRDANRPRPPAVRVRVFIPLGEGGVAWQVVRGALLMSVAVPLRGVTGA
jgi:hypothetical protein